MKREEGVEMRPLIIRFEEPEMYLHPNAAALMRDKIYELATSSFSKIICTIKYFDGEGINIKKWQIGK